MFGPPEKTEIAIRIFQSWIEANRFDIGGSFGILAQLDKQDPTKVTNACVIGMLAFRGGELFEGILRPILLAPRGLWKHLLAWLLDLRLREEGLPTHVTHGNKDRKGSGRISCYGSSADLVTSPKRAVRFSSLLCDSRFSAVESANSRAAFSFSPRDW